MPTTLLIKVSLAWLQLICVNQGNSHRLRAVHLVHCIQGDVKYSKVTLDEESGQQDDNSHQQAVAVHVQEPAGKATSAK